MDRTIADIYDLIQEISWYFGNQGFSGKCCGDLSLVEFMTLKILNAKHNMSVQEVGIALNIKKSGTSKIVNRLENHGYVKRERSLIDGRVCCVAITDIGQEAISKIIGKYASYVGEIVKDIEPGAVNAIGDTLGVFAALTRKQGFIRED